MKSAYRTPSHFTFHLGFLWQQVTFGWSWHKTVRDRIPGWMTFLAQSKPLWGALWRAFTGNVRHLVWDPHGLPPPLSCLFPSSSLYLCFSVPLAGWGPLRRAMSLGKAQGLPQTPRSKSTQPFCLALSWQAWWRWILFSVVSPLTRQSWSFQGKIL